MGTCTRGLCDPKTVPRMAWLNMARLNRLSLTSIWSNGAMAVTTIRASLEPQAQAWAMSSPFSTPGVRMTTSALRPMVSSGSIIWASNSDGAVWVAPISLAFSSLKGTGSTAMMLRAPAMRAP